MCLLQSLDTKHIPLFLFTHSLLGHRASDFMKHDVQSLFHLEKLIPRNQITLLTLSEHTHLNAQNELLKHKSAIGDMASINLQYFYPILPLGHIMVPRHPTTTFSIQGDNYHYVTCFFTLFTTVYIYLFTCCFSVCYGIFVAYVC